MLCSRLLHVEFETQTAGNIWLYQPVHPLTTTNTSSRVRQLLLKGGIGRGHKVVATRAFDCSYLMLGHDSTEKAGIPLGRKFFRAVRTSGIPALSLPAVH